MIWISIYIEIKTNKISTWSKKFFCLIVCFNVDRFINGHKWNSFEPLSFLSDKTEIHVFTYTDRKCKIYLVNILSTPRKPISNHLPLQ